MKLKTTPYSLNDVSIQDGQFHPSRLIAPSDANGEIRLDPGRPGTPIQTRLPADSNYWEWAQKFMVTVKLGIHGIRVSVVGNTPLAGGGVMCDEDLYEFCPHCKAKDCVVSAICPMTRATVIRMKHNASIDAILNLILSHAVAGVDIETPAYLEGIETALMYVGWPENPDVKWFDRANSVELRRFFECGGCDHFHPFGWSGDCRDDGQRYNLDRLDETYGEKGWVLVYETTGLPSGGVYGAERSDTGGEAEDSVDDYVHDIYTMFVASDSQRRDLSVFEGNLTGEQIAAAGRQFEAIRFGTMSESSAKALLRSALVEAGLKERCDDRKTTS